MCADVKSPCHRNIIFSIILLSNKIYAITHIQFSWGSHAGWINALAVKSFDCANIKL